MIFFQDVPKSYSYCFVGKDSCPKASSCLRAIAAELLAENEDPQPRYLSTVNEVYVKRLADQASCTLYRSSEPVRFAKGMTHLYDELPLNQASIVRDKVMSCFSSERYYFHSLKKKGKRISPEIQQNIANVFRATGLGLTPKFDSYEYAIDW